MPEDIKVDTRVTAGLHPRHVQALEGYDADTAHVLAPTYDALDAAYRGIGSVFDAREAAKRNPTLNEAAQLIATQDYADKVFARVAGAIDSAHDNLKKGIDVIEKELTKPVEAQASHQISMEIRSHFNGLKPEERMKKLRHAIETGDHKSATAVLGAPSYLSGFDDEMQTLYLQMYHEKTFPQMAKRLKAMKGAFGLLGERGGLLLREFEKAVGKSAHEVQRLREAKLNAERALQSA